MVGVYYRGPGLWDVVLVDKLNFPMERVQPVAEQISQNLPINDLNSSELILF